MKKKLLTLGKKSLALVMTVMMLTTCWVFMPATHEHFVAEAATDEEVKTANLNALATITGTTDITANAKASFPHDSAGNDGSKAFNNVLWTQNYTNTNRFDGVVDISVTYDKNGWGNGSSAVISYHYSPAVLMYDGVNTPSIGILMTHDGNKTGGTSTFKSTTNGSWLANTDGLVINEFWRGQCGGNLDFAWAINQPYAADYRPGKYDYYFTTDSKSSSEPSTANIIKYTGKMDDQTFHLELYPIFHYYGSGSSGGERNPEATGGQPIHVINVKPLKKAYTEALAIYDKIQKNPAEYSTSSVNEFVTLAQALLDANPNKYTWSSDTTKVSNYASAAKTAVDNWNEWGGLKGRYNITWNVEGVKTIVKVDEGTVPAYDGTPTKADSEDGYRYTFSRWNPTPVAVTGEAEYKAEFTATLKSYTIRFYDAEGNELSSNVYNHGDSINAPTAPTIDGYDFAGWSPSYSSIATGNVDYTATYNKMWTITYYDGDMQTVIATVSVINGKPVGSLPNVTPTKATDKEGSYRLDHWTSNSEEFTVDTVVTSDMKVYPVFIKTAHGNYVYGTQAVSPSNCTENAVVIMYCGNCGYSFGQVKYDPSIDPDKDSHTGWLAKGHTFGNVPVPGSSTGNTDNDTHLVKCSIRGCNATNAVKHIWNKEGTSGATCTIPGTVHWTCSCGAAKDTTGALAPDNHVNTVKKNGYAATCTTDGKYDDTYCNDCQTVVEVGGVIPMLGHSFTDYESDGNATCTADGTKTAKCDRCDATDTIADVGSKLDHTYTNYVYNNDAKCGVDGTKTAECDTCDTGAKDTVTAEGTALEHKFEGEIKNNEDGTHSYKCTNEDCDVYGGTTDCTYGEWDKTGETHHVKTCSVCSYELKESHQFSAWTTTDFYKNEPGEQKRSCSVCGREETKTCTYTSTYYPATCTTAEHTDYKCSDCGHGYSITGKAALGHDYTGTVQSFNNGTHNFLCKNGCNTYGFEKTLNALATCDYKYENTATGTHKATCKVCNYSFNENCSGGTATCTEQAKCTKCNTAYGTTAPHSYTGRVVQLDGDKHAYLCVFCSTEGLYGVGAEKDATEACSGGTATCTDKAVCDKCKDTHGTTAPHTFNGTPVVLDGDVHAYRCSVCNNNSLYGVGAEENATEACSGGDATCTALAVCTVCNDTHGALDTDDHKWGAWTNIAGTETHTRVCEYNEEHTQTTTCESSGKAIVEADCESEGYDLNTCDFCNHQWKTNFVPALEHAWGAWVSDDKGSHTRTCEREGCHYADDHTAKTETASCTKDNADAVVTAPTCLDKGYTTYTCKDCGYEWVDDYTDATGHSYVGKKKRVDDIYVRTEKDCTTDWTYWYSCDNCKVSAETEKDKYDNEADLYWVREVASDHKYAMIEEDQYLASEADCEAKATYYYSCSVCKKSSKGTGDERTFSTGKKLGHNWVKPADDVLATYLATSSDCINDATYYYVCSRTGCGISSKDYDGSTWVKENSKSGHDFDHDNDGVLGNEGDAGYTAGVAANCTKGGVVEHYTCETCNKHFKVDKITEISAAALEIAPLRHDYKDVPAKDATCDTAGYTAHKVCQREGCNYRNDRYKEIPAKGHDYTGEIKNNEDGTHSYLCVNGCGTYGGAVDCEFNGEYNKVVVDGKHYHEIACECGNAERTECVDSKADYVDPTCTEAGYYAHTCDVCGSTWTVVGDTDEDKALGHNFEKADWVQIAGKDKHSRKCIRCDVTVTEDCSSINVSTSCGNQNVCDKCHQPFGKQIEHVWSNVKDDAYLKSAATCTDDAVYFKKCANCNTKSDKYIWVAAGTATGHTMLPDYTYDITGWTAPEGFDLEIKKPTCGEGGLAINYCTKCDYYVTKNIPKDESLHEFGEKEIISDNCATGVIYKQVCKFCFAEITSIGESMKHEYVLQSIKYATCTENSVETYACKNCGDSYETNNVKAKGHTWGEPVEDKAATCKNPGRAFKYCSVCGASEKVTLPQLVHAWDKNNDGIIDDGFTPDANDNSYIYVAATDATCSADGYEGYFKCLDCSYDQHLDARWLAISGNYKPATGHVDKDGDGECDGKGCNKTFGDSSSSSGDCGCICHKTNWFSKIIYKILKFFWKLFGIGKACDCGTVHY